MAQVYKIISAIVVALLLLPSASLAQISPGTKLLEIGLGRYSGPFADNPGNIGFMVAPAAGIFVKENVVIGLAVGVASLGKHNGENNSPNNMNYAILNNAHSYLAIAPFVRRYFWLSEKLSIQAEFQTGYSWSDSRYLDERNDPFSFYKFESSKQSQILFAAFRPGFTYLVSPRIALAATSNAMRFGISNLKYNNSGVNMNKGTGVAAIQGNEGESRSRQFELNASLTSFTLGASFFIGR